MQGCEFGCDWVNLSDPAGCNRLVRARALPPRIVTTRPLLTARGVSKAYGKVEALRDVSAIVYPGEVLGIVGESGSGKSTFLRCLNLEETPDTGSYTLDLPDVQGNLFDLDRYARRMLCATRIGILYQNPHLGL